MKELLEHIVKSIVNNPDEVKIEERESVDFPGLTILTIEVAETDKGVVIGRKGRTINAIRDLITINAIRNERRVKVMIKDDNNKHMEEPAVEEGNSSEAENESIFNDEI
ncbi:MAG: KH domain-containing protein [Candidatus Dojkabacteria bacterium]